MSEPILGLRTAVQLAVAIVPTITEHRLRQAITTGELPCEKGPDGVLRFDLETLRAWAASLAPAPASPAPLALVPGSAATVAAPSQLPAPRPATRELDGKRLAKATRALDDGESLVAVQQRFELTAAEAMGAFEAWRRMREADPRAAPTVLVELRVHIAALQARVEEMEGVLNLPCEVCGELHPIQFAACVGCEDRARAAEEERLRQQADAQRQAREHEAHERARLGLPRRAW